MARGTVPRSHPSRGFTLMEVLVALVIFGVITVAISFTFDTALTTQQANIRRLEELGAVRSVFDYLTRDLQQAYATSNSTSAAFIAAGDQSGPQNASGGGLLTLMTRGNRIISDSPDATTSAPAGPVSTSSDNPQSETAMVRYDFDPQTHSLSRTVIGVPNLQLLQQSTTDPDTVISSLIDSISFRFWDPTAQSWRTDWDYEQQNQQAAAATDGTGTTAGTNTGGTATPAAGTTASGSSTAGTGDTTLPGMVEVTVTIRHHDSTTATYVSTIAVVTPQVADGTAPPTNTGTTTATGAGTTAGGAN